MLLGSPSDAHTSVSLSFSLTLLSLSHMFPGHATFQPPAMPQSPAASTCRECHKELNSASYLTSTGTTLGLDFHLTATRNNPLCLEGDRRAGGGQGREGPCRPPPAPRGHEEGGGGGTQRKRNFGETGVGREPCEHHTKCIDVCVCPARGKREPDPGDASHQPPRDMLAGERAP